MNFEEAFKSELAKVAVEGMNLRKLIPPGDPKGETRSLAEYLRAKRSLEGPEAGRVALARARELRTPKAFRQESESTQANKEIARMSKKLKVLSPKPEAGSPTA